MGYRVSWIARSGSSTHELIQASGRSLSGEHHEFPDVGWYLLEVSNEGSPWALLIADGTENFADLSASQAKLLSQAGNETLFFSCSETVMVTEMHCFKHGAEIWSIEYDCGDEKKQPTMNGDVPKMAYEILKDLQTKQQASVGTDFIYELTAELGRSLVGFRHDIEIEVDDAEPFQLLREPTKRPLAWWQVWKRR